MAATPDEDFNETNQMPKRMYRFMPPFCVGHSFRGITTCDITFLWGRELSPWDYEVTGRNMQIVLWEALATWRGS